MFACARSVNLYVTNTGNRFRHPFVSCRPRGATIVPILATPLRLLLRRSLGLGGLLPVASDHDGAQERTDNGTTNEDEDDGDADGPNAGRKEVLERVVVINEGLSAGVRVLVYLVGLRAARG